MNLPEGTVGDEDPHLLDDPKSSVYRTDTFVVSVHEVFGEISVDIRGVGKNSLGVSASGLTREDLKRIGEMLEKF